MGHKVKIVDKERFETGMKIFIEVTIDGEKIGYPELDGEVHKFNFDMDYERYEDNKKVERDAAAWGRKVIRKRVEEYDPSPDPVGSELEI